MVFSLPTGRTPVRLYHELGTLHRNGQADFSQATTFDLVLPRLLAGEPIGNHELASLGHGGLLSREMAYRFPPYRANAARGELE